MNNKEMLDPVKYALHNRLKYLFYKEHDCKIDHYGGTELAMSEDKFIEVVSKIVESNMIEKEIK